MEVFLRKAFGGSMLSVVVVCVLAVAMQHVFAGGFINCEPTGPVSCSCDGAQYSLANMAPISTQYLTYFEPGGEYLFFLQFVNGGLTSSTVYSGYTCSLPKSGYVAGQLQISSGNSCFALSTITATGFTLDTTQDTPVLSVSFSGGQSSKRMIVSVVCAPNQLNPIIIDEYESGTPAIYFFTIEHKSACQGGVSPVGPGFLIAPKKDEPDEVFGAIFFSLLLGGLFLYFVIGAVYKWKVKGLTGTELIMNKDFWTSLPGFVKEGFRFTWSKIRRQDYQKL